jgi:colanic acid/amylovoran biosynthesis glycosyltransferase
MPEPLTIGYLTSYYARVGDTYVRREVEQLRRMGHVVHTFSQRQSDPSELASEEIRREHAQTVYLLDAGPIRLTLAALRWAIREPGRFVEASRLVFRSVPPGIKNRWVRRVAYLLQSAHLAELLRARKVQHLHNHIGESSALIAMLASVFSGVPYSVTIHGPGEFDRPTLLALDEKIRHAAFVVAICEFTRSQLYRWSDYADWPRIHVVRVGVSPMFLAHGPAPIPAAPRLVNIGRIVEQKGQSILVQAAAALRDRGLEFELVIVGDGPMRGEMERLIDQFDLRGRVRIVGYLNSQGVLEELLNARALVLPSFAEGLPGVFFEAMALGRPVISTSIAGHSELIEPGVNGWLVPAGAVEPLVDAMTEALTTEPAELERMGRAGAARVAERHDGDTEVRKLVALFAEAGGAASRPDPQVARSALVGTP